MGWQDDPVVGSAPKKAAAPAWAKDPVVSPPGAPEAEFARPVGMLGDVFASPSPPPAAPQQTRPGLWDRFTANAERAFQGGTLQGGLLNLFDQAINSGVQDNLRRWGYTENAEDYARRVAQPGASERRYEAMPSFSDAPTFTDKVIEGGTSLAGQLAGSLFSPESFVTAGPRALAALERVVAPAVTKVAPKALAPAATRIAARGTEQAAINTALDPAIQTINVVADKQEAVDPLQVALAAPLGFLVGSTVALPGEAGAGLKGMADSFRAWRAARAAPRNPGTTSTPEAPPTPQEVDDFAGSPEMAAFLRANGVTDPTDPRIIQLQDRLAARRGAESDRARFDLQDAGGSKLSAFNKDQNRLAAERDGVTDGDMVPSAASTAGRVPRQPIQEPIPVDSRGRADIGDPAMRVATDKFGADQAGLPVTTEPQPTRMTPDEIARSRAKMEGGNPNTAEPPGRMVAGEGRLPQTPDQVQGQRQAAEAFTQAEAQRGRAGAAVRDTQPAARPQGDGQQTVVLDEGFPVQIQARGMKRVGDREVEIAVVQRVDPRTGELDPDATPYEVPVRQLKTSRYAKEPRQAQDFVQRAEGPPPPERPRMSDQGIIREDMQTYRTTRQDENTGFPGATNPGPEDGAGPQGRSPIPEQPPGRGPWRERPTREDEAIRDFEARQRDQETFDYRKRQGEGPRQGDSKTSSVAAAVDADGRFAVDDRGFVNSDKGGPIRFSDQKQAAKWVINEGHKKSPDQIFEIENHPSGKGFTVRERGRTEGKPDNEPPPSDGPSSQRGKAGGARAAEAGGPPGALPPPREAPRPKLSEAGRAHYEAAVADVARAKTAEPKRAATGGTLFDAIRELGGIRDDRGDVAQIMQGFKNERFKRRVLNPNGLHPDKMREALQERGWFGTESRFGSHARETGSYPGDDVRDLYDLMDREARGEPVRHPSHQSSDADFEAEARRYLDEEMDAAGISDGDTPEDAARKLAEFRASQEADFLARDLQQEIDDDLAGLSDAGREYYDAEYEPGSDYGAELEEGGGFEKGRGGPEVQPEGSRNSGSRSGEAGGPDRPSQEAGRGEPRQESVPGTEREATAEELRARAARRDAEERQQNPRAYSGKAQKAADEGLFADQSEKNQTDLFTDEAVNRAERDLGDTFYSNPIADPKVWRELARTLVDIFGWAKKEADEWSRHLESITTAFPKKGEKGAGALAHVRGALEVAFFSNDGMLRSMSSRYKSPAIREIADLFFAAPRGGLGGAVGQTYFEAQNERYGRWMNELDELFKPMAKMRVAEREQVLDQIGRLIVNPGAIKPGTPVHDAAAGVGKMLKDILGYMREAGVEVGEVRRGYLPRMENTDKIMSDPEGFRKAATRAFLADGVPAKEARASADEWFNRILLGDLGIHSDSNDFASMGGGDGTASFTRGRTLSKKADDILNDYYLRNPADIMPQYILRAVKKAEWSRRFGPRDKNASVPRGEDRAEWLADPLGKWKDYKQRMIDDGAGEAIPEVVKTVKSITGNIGQAATGSTRNFLSLARTWSAFSYLSRATFSSLSEPVSVGIRTGNAMDALRAYGNTVRHWVPILRKQGGGKYLEEMAKDLGFIGDAIDNLSMLQRVGNDDNTQLARRLQTNYFRHIGLTQFTEANRVAAMQGGMVFLRRLANDIVTNSPYAGMSRNLLSELGIGQATAKGANGDPVEGFARWVMDRDKQPNISDLLEGGDMGRLYHTALGRFLAQTVMHPTGATRPRYAQHPLGSLFYNLMSFIYAFQKNVLNRVGAMTKDAVDPKSGLSAAERMRYLAPLGMLVPLVAVQYGLGEIRDVIFPDPARAGQQPKSEWDKIMTAVSRSGLTGISDPLINTFGSLRYQRDPAIALAGPIYGTPLQVMSDVGGLMGERNSPNTNTQERKAARDAYDLAVKPALIAATTAVAPASTPLGMALGAAGIFGIAHPAARERAVKAVAGPPMPRR